MDWTRDAASRARNAAMIGHLAQGCNVIRSCGSAALALCYVAAGWWDAYWHLSIQPWDVAAGALIVREAGGQVTDLAGQRWELDTAPVLASNGLLHARSVSTRESQVPFVDATWNDCPVGKAESVVESQCESTMVRGGKMLVDVHVHCSKLRHPKVSRVGGSQYPTPERLIAMMDDNGIDVAVFMCGVSPEWRYTAVIPEEALEICAMYPERLVPFCNLDPRYMGNSADSDFSPLLEAYIELGCKGVGEYIPNLPVDDPLNMNLFAQVQEAGLPLTFHLAPKVGGYYGMADELGLPRLEKVLRAFPKLTFLAHSQVFWAEISADVTERSAGAIPRAR